MAGDNRVGIVQLLLIGRSMAVAETASMTHRDANFKLHILGI